MSVRFSLVIPCFNEAANLPSLVGRCAPIFARSDAEVIFVNNGSTDNSSEVFEALLSGISNARLVEISENQGYGHGIASGLSEALGDYLGWTHADMQTDPEDFLIGLKLLRGDDQALFVKGRRYGRRLSDVIFTVGMSLFESALFQRLLWDINAQPTIFPKQFFQNWSDPPKDFSLDLFAYILAHQSGLKVRRFRVFFGDRLHGDSSWNINWRAKWKFISRTVAFSIQLRRNL